MFLRTRRLCKYQVFELHFDTHTFAGQIEILPFEFRKDFQELLQEADQLNCEIFFILASHIESSVPQKSSSK